MSKNSGDADALVTGGGGLIGSFLVERLLGEGKSVAVLAHSREDLWRLRPRLKKMTVLRADLADEKKLERILGRKKFKYVYHLAAVSCRENSLAGARESIRVNLWGTVNLISAIGASACKSFVNIGTSDEYGDNQVPFREDQPPRPLSFYAASKSAASLFADIFRKERGIPVVNLRLFLVYGPRQSADFFIPQVILAALRGKDFKMTEGEQTRDFVYVRDAAEGILIASRNGKAVGETINLCSGREYKIREVAEKIKAMTGSSFALSFGALPYREGEIGRIYGDNSKARRLLGWKPRTALDEGLGETVRWYRRNLARF